VAIIWSLTLKQHVHSLIKVLAICVFFVTTSAFISFLHFHFLNVQKLVKDQIHYRNSEVILNSWKVLNTHVTKRDQLILVTIVPLGDLTDVKRLFFGRNGLAYALDLPFTNELPYLTTSIQDLHSVRCELERHRITINPEQVYTFVYDVKSGLQPKIVEGRALFPSWNDYCSLGIPGNGLD
jgi:hypothetical protein